MAYLAPDHPGATQRHEQILAAAKQCFRSEGFHAASMANIAATAGLSVGQIYRYFQNKEAIVEAIIKGHVEDTRQDIDDLAAQSGDLAVNLASHIHRTIRRVTRENHPALIFEVKAQAARSERLDALFKAADDDCRLQIRELLRNRGEDGPSNEEMDARVEMLGVLYEGMLMRQLKHPESDDDTLEPLLNAMIATVLGG